MEGTWKPAAAGILNIISGAFFLIAGITIIGLLDTPMATAVARYYMYSVDSSGAVTSSVVIPIISVTAALLIVPSIVSLLGGICAIRKRVWGLALAGAIFTVFYLPPLGIPGIIFTVLSKKEFA